MSEASGARLAAASRADNPRRTSRRIYTRRSRPLITGDLLLVALMWALSIFSLACFIAAVK